MKSFIVFALIVAAAIAAPAGPDADAVVVNQETDNIGVGPYRFKYETSNGISASEQGEVKDVGTENEGIETSGQFSYLGSDGVLYTVKYLAGRNGFQPQGDHLPKSP